MRSGYVELDYTGCHVHARLVDHRLLRQAGRMEGHNFRYLRSRDFQTSAETVEVGVVISGDICNAFNVTVTIDA
jgi:hypothetical protein